MKTLSSQFPWKNKRSERGEAIRTVCSLIGAIVLARAVAEMEFSDEIRHELRKGYIHFKAKECMDQAILVAQRQKFNSKTIQNGCKSEGKLEAFGEFKRRLDETSSRPATKNRRNPV